MKRAAQLAISLLMILVACDPDQPTAPRAAMRAPGRATSVSVAGMTLLPLTAGWTDAEAAGINDFGQVVGKVGSNITFRSTASLWTPLTPNGTNPSEMTMTDLVGTAGFSGAGYAMWGYAINATGTVVGRFVPPVGGYTQGFIWVPSSSNNATGGPLTPLVPSDWFVSATALNNSGQVVGNNEIDGGAYFFLWDGSSFTYAGAPLPASGSLTWLSSSNPGFIRDGGVTGINDYGQIVGRATDYPGLGLELDGAFLWTPRSPNVGTIVRLDAAPLGGRASRATAINTYGQVVGSYDDISTGGTRAFLWTPTGKNLMTGTMVALPTLGGSTEAFGINDRGQVVGSTESVAGFNAFVWTPDADNSSTGTIQSIQLSANPIKATGINNKGQVVGTYFDGSANRAVLWTITETSQNTQASNPPGSPVVVVPLDRFGNPGPVTLTFSNVTTAGNTTIDLSGSGPPVPSTYQLLSNPPLFYGISTTAVYTGPITVCIDYGSPVTTPPVFLLHFDGTSWIQLTPAPSPSPTTICGTTTTLSPFVLATFLVDATPPEIVGSVSPAPNAAGWNKAGVVVTWTVIDPESGIASSTGCASATLSSETAKTDVTCTATNGVGLSTTQTVTVRIDKTAPVLSVANVVANATSPAGAAVIYAASATDNLDPAPTISCAPPSGSTFAIGVTSVACTATDKAGNVGPGSFTVTVRGAADQIVDLIEFLRGTPIGDPTNCQGTGEFQCQDVDQRILRVKLTAFLQAALANAGNRSIVCAKLNLFLNRVNSPAGRASLGNNATETISRAMRIKAVIGCP